MYSPGQVERLRAHIHSLKAEQHNRDLAELRLVCCNHAKKELNDSTLDVIGVHKKSQPFPANSKVYVLLKWSCGMVRTGQKVEDSVLTGVGHADQQSM